MTHDQAEIIRQCISVLREIESDRSVPERFIQAMLARNELENLLRKYKPQEPNDAS